MYKKGSELGHARSMNSIACYYLKEEISEKSKEKAEAFKLIKKAAEMGEVDAMWNLHRCYERGIGTEVDMERSSFWLSKYLNKCSLESKRERVWI